MPNVQPNYNQTLAVGVPGLLVNQEPYTVISREVQTVAGIAFGGVVVRGTGDHQCQAGNAGTNFLGIARLNPAVRADENNAYSQYDTCAIVQRGVVWVIAAVAVTPGQQAYFDASGNITNVATSNTIIVGGFFDTTAGIGGLVKLRLK